MPALYKSDSNNIFAEFNLNSDKMETTPEGRHPLEGGSWQAEVYRVDDNDYDDNDGDDDGDELMMRTWAH